MSIKTPDRKTISGLKFSAISVRFAFMSDDLRNAIAVLISSNQNINQENIKKTLRTVFKNYGHNSFESFDFDMDSLKKADKIMAEKYPEWL